MTDKPESMALLLAGMGYKRAQVVAAVCEGFPDRYPAYVERIVDDAYERVARQEAELDRAVERDQSAARTAEHDLTQTMHQPHQEDA